MRDAKERRSTERARSGHIGEILVSWGKLTREQLRAALDLEKNDPRKLGEILLSQNLVSGEDLARAVAEATGFEYVSLSESSVDPAAIPLLDEKVLRKHRALPLRVESGRLVLAMSDPTNVLALDDLKTLAGYPIRPVVAAAESISSLQDRLFGAREETPGFLETDKGSVKSPIDNIVSIPQGEEGAPAVRFANSIIRQALAEGASDIHVEPRAEKLVVRYRVDGVLKPAMSAPLRLKDSVISRLKVMGDLGISMRLLRY